MDDLFKAIARAEIEQKLDLLPQLLSAETKGIDYLIESLGDAELVIRAKAYELLQNITSQQVQQAIAPGILLQPGDKVYGVIQFSVWFDDSFYSLSSRSDNNTKHLVTEDDYRQQFERIISFEESATYVVSTKDYYIDYQQAELAAKKLNQQLYQQVISKISITEFEENNREILIKQWCDRHNLLTEVTAFQREKNRNLGIDRWLESVGLSDDSENFEIYWSTVEEYLKSIANFDLLEQLWRDLVGNLTCIKEITFNKPTYLKIDPYYSQITASTNKFVFFDGDEEERFLTSEELEIRLLTEALNNPQLSIRFLAYQLLQGTDLETERQVVSKGIKLNPGDKVYSVYQSGIWFDDQNYNIYDERYLIDYLDDLNYQIYGRKLLDEEEERIKCQRIYYYLDKEQAEAKAEALHREMIHNNGIGIGVMGFEWRKKNPNFDARQWCNQYNISYPDVEFSNIPGDNYEVIWKIKDFLIESSKEDLIDNLRRSRYIYHPKHIDNWCDDNQVKYDPNLDNWNNYRQVIDYLYQPENIALLSKFWKDGVGHFAFVKEEVVQETIYLKPGEKLSDRPEAKILKIQSALKPENYPKLASRFLINIIENKHDSTEQKSKARELLQKIPREYLPF